MNTKAQIIFNVHILEYVFYFKLNVNFHFENINGIKLNYMETSEIKLNLFNYAASKTATNDQFKMIETWEIHSNQIHFIFILYTEINCRGLQYSLFFFNNCLYFIFSCFSKFIKTVSEMMDLLHRFFYLFIYFKPLLPYDSMRLWNDSQCMLILSMVACLWNAVPQCQGANILWQILPGNLLCNLSPLLESPKCATCNSTCSL